MGALQMMRWAVDGGHFVADQTRSRRKSAQKVEVAANMLAFPRTAALVRD